MPVVCAVNGVAAGAGASYALACDIVLAARSAKFIQAFVKIGLVPDLGASFFLPRLVGEARARALAMLGEPVDAERAEAWGMIWRVVDDAALQEEAEALTAHLATQPTEALAAMKRMFAASRATRWMRSSIWNGSCKARRGAARIMPRACARSSRSVRRHSGGALNDVVRARAEAMWAEDRASAGLGMRMEEIAPGRARLSMPVTEAMANSHGICHGGFIFALADSAMAFAANSRGEHAVAQHASITYVRPARVGEMLVAEAVERMHAGRSGMYDVRVSGGWRAGGGVPRPHADDRGNIAEG